MSAEVFLVKNSEAIKDLIDKVVVDASAKLPCLALGKDNPRPRLKDLIEKTVAAKEEGGDGCTGAWEEDGTFVVTVQDHIEVGEMRISVALSLAETRIRG
jgi:hypothetical protein